MTNKILDDLVLSKSIFSYNYENVSEEGIVGETSDFRNSERLVITFHNKEKLIIDTMCSGCKEDTSLTFSNNESQEN